MRFAHAIFLALAIAFMGLSGAAVAGEPLTIVQPVGFAEEAFVRPEVRDECQLQTKVPGFIAEYAKADFDISTATSAEGNGPGKVLVVEVIGTDEAGNAWTGRQKALTIRGELRENGEVIGSFKARRSTMGGFMGGYKGNCAFFGRCAKAIGQDVANWLKKPAMNSVIGG
jgi:hypothetical protein